MAGLSSIFGSTSPSTIFDRMKSTPLRIERTMSASVSDALRGTIGTFGNAGLGATTTGTGAGAGITGAGGVTGAGAGAGAGAGTTDAGGGGGVPVTTGAG